jgi:hypothetical protein
MLCCPSRPAHSRSRAFFRAAATLTFVVGSLNGTLGTNARADYLNPLGSTVGTGFNQSGTSVSSAVNNGTITTDAYAIRNGSGASITTVTNAGTINVDVYGIANFSSSMGTVTNSGTINSEDYAVANFDATSTLGTFLNSGTINASDAYAFANFGGAAITHFTNSGTISSAFVAVNNGGSTITNFTNAGTLSGGSSYAIMNSGTIGTLTLAAGSQTNGGIQNSGTIGTLDIATGASITGNIANSGTISILNITAVAASANFDLNTAGVNITGNQPISTNLNLSAPSSAAYVTVGNRTAGVDKSAFGANGQSIRQVTGSISRLANTNGLIQSIGAKIASQNADPYAMTSDLCADGAPAPAGQIGNSDFWVRGFTGRNKVDATAASVDYINTYSGGAVGIERDWSEGLRAGAFIGAGSTDNNLGGGLGGSAADLIFMGAYATKVMGTLFAKVGLTGGRGNNTGTRNIAAGTPETALADYDSWYLSPEASVGKVYDLGQRLGGTFTMTPVLTVRYVYAHQDGYTETGATNNLTMNDSHSTTVEERAELKFSYATETFGDYRVKLNASVGGLGQQNGGGAMSGALLGAPLSFATPGNQNFTGFVGGLGFEISRGKYTFTAYGDYVRLDGGNTDISANAVFSVKF